MPDKRVDQSILEMALIGYEVERQRIEAKIREIRDHLNGAGKHTTKTPAVEEGVPVRKRRSFSEATKRRMAAAQKRRWKALKKAQKKRSEVPF